MELLPIVSLMLTMMGKWTMCTNKIYSLLFLCMLSSGLYAEKIWTHGKADFSESAREQTIQMMLFGNFSFERNVYTYMRPTDHEVYTWYFFEKDDYFQCLAFFVQNLDDPKNDYACINTSHNLGTRCLIASGHTLYDKSDPVLYFWDGGDPVDVSEMVPVSWRTDRGVFTKKIPKRMRDIEIADFSRDGYGEQELISIEGLKNFPRLENIIVSSFAVANPKSIQYPRKANLIFRMCAEVSIKSKVDR